MNKVFVVVLIFFLGLTLLVNYSRLASSRGLSEEDYIEKVMNELGYPKSGPGSSAVGVLGRLFLPVKNFYRNQDMNPFGTFNKGTFNGFHTGADVEVDVENLDKDVAVYAIYGGVVEEVEFASGYGGLVTVKHKIGSKTFLGIYGHLRLRDVKVKPGQSVVGGSLIGYLGAGYSSETDGQKKHLHFGLRQDASRDIRGYVDTNAELTAGWLNPTTFLRQLGAERVE